MNHDLSYFIPSHFDDHSRVWIYQAERSFTPSEVGFIETLLDNFVAEWNSHGSPVKGFASVLFSQFIVLMADETGTGVSGCSTDSSVRLIKNIERELQVDLFDRLKLGFLVDGEITIIPLSTLDQAIEKNAITPDTPYFNNAILNKKDFSSKWIISAGDSWLGKRFKSILQPLTK